MLDILGHFLEIQRFEVMLMEIKDMGLGKTLSMLALITSSANHDPSSSTEYREQKTTLVVTPLSRKSTKKRGAGFF